MPEPQLTAVQLLLFAVLLAVSTLFSRASGRIGVPVALLLIALGVLVGAEGLGALSFANYHLGFRVGTMALALILFDGGLNTPLADLRLSWAPAGVLATVGVALTAALTAAGARLLGFSWGEALVLGAVVSSTDAAALFAVLRGGGIQLQKRAAVILELESGVNDPLAVILTITATEALATGKLRPGMLLLIPAQITIGAGLGLAIGFAARYLLARVQLPAGGLYAVLSIAIAFLAFSVPTLLFGSGFLAVYAAGVVLGNGALPYRSGLLRVHDALAWFSQIVMFLLLGLLALPSRLIAVSADGFALGLFLAVVARPVAALACLVPFSLSWRERLAVAWVGLRGAVPVILATYPVLRGVPGSLRMFDVIFFVVVVSTLVPGSTIRWVVRRLRLEDPSQAPAPAVLEISSAQPLKGKLLAFYIDPASTVAGARIADLPFPQDAAAMLIVRGRTLIAPKGPTVIEPLDHVYVFCNPEDQAFISLLFGRHEGDWSSE